MVQSFAIDFILIYLVTRNERLCAWFSFKERCFQKVISIEAVGPVFRFNLSYRDVVELLQDRGITVHHTTVMRWVHHYGPIFKAL
jgi:transposase-like protein